MDGLITPCALGAGLASSRIVVASADPQPRRPLAAWVRVGVMLANVEIGVTMTLDAFIAVTVPDDSWNRPTPRHVGG